MRIAVTIHSPSHVRRSGPWGDLILFSHRFPEIPDSIDAQELIELMEVQGREWSAILLQKDHEGLRASLWRSLTSSFHVYYTLQGSTLFLSDTFAGCAVNVPKPDRHPSDDAVLDIFLFRTPFGENTYFEQVQRVGHGMRVDIRPGGRSIEKQQFAMQTPCPEPDSEKEYVDRVDDAMERSLAEFRGQDYALLFSGGVDSTLLATYLPQNRLVNNKITSPEWNPEVTYAQEAATLLGRYIAVNELDEQDYLVRMEDMVDRIWMPPHHGQTAVLSAAFTSDEPRFILGQLADGLFGMFNHKRGYYGPMLAKPGIRQVVGVLGAMPSRRLKKWSRWAKSFGTAPTMPESFGLRFACQDIRVARRLFSMSEINKRLLARYAYVAKFVSFESLQARRSAQLEVGHQIDYFCDDTVGLWSQLASMYGKSLYTPFINPHVFAAAMSIPASERYMDRRTVKHVLKKLLVRRLPSYPAYQTKLAGAVPLRRFVASGPLQKWSERYPPPDFISAETLQMMHDTNLGFFWNTIIFSIWKGRIADLDSVPTPLLTLNLGSMVGEAQTI